MWIEQTTEVPHSIDDALNVLWEWVENNIRVHSFFWNLDKNQTDIADRLLKAQLLRVS